MARGWGDGGGAPGWFRRVAARLGFGCAPVPLQPPSPGLIAMELKWVSILCSSMGRDGPRQARASLGPLSGFPTPPCAQAGRQSSCGSGERVGGEETVASRAAEEAMPAEGTRMARLWEREVGRLPPRRFAGAVRASEVLLRLYLSSA
jgi:hypothetical protein